MDVRVGGSAGTSEAGFGVKLPFDAIDDSGIEFDLSALQTISPMLAVRLELCATRHREQGVEVAVTEPTRAAAKRTMYALGLFTDAHETDVTPDPVHDVVLPLTRLTELTQIDRLGESLYGVLSDRFGDLAVVRDAVLMAVAELCQNAVEHGGDPLGCVACAMHSTGRDDRRMTFAVGDLGVGIPQHMRRRYPDYVDDGHAIAAAVQTRDSGTGDPHRGFGFDSVFEETLASAATGAELRIRSGCGRFLRVIADGAPKDEGGVHPGVRGTWLLHEWVTAGAAAPSGRSDP